MSISYISKLVEYEHCAIIAEFKSMSMKLILVTCTQPSAIPHAIIASS